MKRKRKHTIPSGSTVRAICPLRTIDRREVPRGSVGIAEHFEHGAFGRPQYVVTWDGAAGKSIVHDDDVLAEGPDAKR